MNTLFSPLQEFWKKGDKLLLLLCLLNVAVFTKTVHICNAHVFLYRPHRKDSFRFTVLTYISDYLFHCVHRVFDM